MRLPHPCPAVPGGTGWDFAARAASFRNRHDFSADLLAFHDQPSQADRQFESLRPRTAGIEVQHSVARLLFWDMTVAVDDYVESGRFWLQIERAQIMQNINRNAADLGDFGFRQLARPRALIDVAANGTHGSNPGQFFENFGIAYVSGVNDAL